MNRGERRYKTMAEHKEAIIETYKSLAEKPASVKDFADSLGITRAYLYKMGLSAPALNKLVVDSL